MGLFVKCFIMLLTMTACTVVMSINNDIEQENGAAEERLLTDRDPEIKEDVWLHAQDRFESGQISARGEKKSEQVDNEYVRLKVQTYEEFLSNSVAWGKFRAKICWQNCGCMLVPDKNVHFGNGFASYYRAEPPNCWREAQVTHIVIHRTEGDSMWYPDHFNVSVSGIKEYICEWASLCERFACLNVPHIPCLFHIDLGNTTIPCRPANND